MGVEEVAPEMRAAVAEGTRAGLEKLGVKGAEIVQENIRTPYGSQPPAVAFGNLAGSIVSSFMREATMCREVIGVSPSLGADAYAAPVETGTSPHMPPPSVLVRWVMRKFGADDKKQALGIAFAVARTIKKRGTRGHFMFERALESLEPLVQPALETSLAQAFTAHGFKGGEA